MIEIHAVCKKKVCIVFWDEGILTYYYNTHFKRSQTNLNIEMLNWVEYSVKMSRIYIEREC